MQNFLLSLLPEQVKQGHEVWLFVIERYDYDYCEHLESVLIGYGVRVVRLNGDGALKRRIMDMGITKGTSLYVKKLAPLGDPMELTVRGYELSLRKADAQMVEVEP